MRLRQPEAGRQFRPLREREVLRSLKSSVELLQLQGTVDGAGFAHFLALAVHPQAGVLDFVREEICNEKKISKLDKCISWWGQAINRRGELFKSCNIVARADSARVRVAAIDQTQRCVLARS